MTGLATNEAIHREGAEQFSFVAPTRSNSSSSSAPKATRARILGLAVSFLIFPSHVASREKGLLSTVARSCSSSSSTAERPQPQAALNSPQESDQQSPGTITGTISDPSGAAIPGAIVKLTRAGQTSLAQAVSDEDGRFVFLDVAPGEFRLTITVEGFQTQEVSGTVHPREDYLAPQITLSLAVQITSVTVTPKTQEEVAEQQIKAQETQRVLGFVPNFYVSYVSNAAPLTFKQKMELAGKTSVDPITIGAVAIGAGIEQERNWYRSYGQGAQGYAKRFAATYANVADGLFLGGALMPALLKQDPRYFYKGTGRRSSRLWYALSRSVVAKGDNGNWQPNYSEFLGNLAAAGISCSYRPAKNRNVGYVFQTAGIGAAESALFNVFQEFVIRKLTPKLSRHNAAEP
jgi:hypothetical protein